MSGFFDDLGEFIGKIMLIGFVFGVLCSLPAFGLGYLLGRRSAAPPEE